MRVQRYLKCLLRIIVVGLLMLMGTSCFRCTYEASAFETELFSVGYLALTNGTGFHYGLQIMKYKGSSGYVSIPNTIKGTPVIDIASGAFKDQKQIVSVSIPDTVFLIDHNAFQNCTALRSIKLPKGLEEIRYHAFDGCAKLEKVSIPEGTLKIGAHCFAGCSCLSSVYIPKTATQIDNDAFNNCTSLTTVNGILNPKIISMQMFSNCSNLEEIIMGDEVQEIQSNAFGNCISLKTVNFGKNVKTLNACFTNCFALEEIRLNPELQNIKRQTFYKCSNLKKIYMYPKMQNLDYDAFYLCNNIDKVYYYGSEIEYNNLEIGTQNGSLDTANVIFNCECPHTYHSTIAGVAATCTTDGVTEGEKCAFCGKILVEQETIKKGHTPEDVPAKEATCTEQGYTAGEKCSICGAHISGMVVIPPKGHDPIAVPAKAATCTESGNEKGTRCSVCGAVLEGCSIIPAGHIPITVKEIPATYEAAGCTSGMKCSVCGKVLSGCTIIPKLVNNYTSTQHPITIPQKSEIEQSQAPIEPITVLQTPASVKAKAKKNKVTVSWKKIKKNKKGKALLRQISGIQVQYSMDPGFIVGNTVTKSLSKKKSSVKLKLQRKSTYYIRVRYVGNGGYSNWSGPKVVRTK